MPLFIGNLTFCNALKRIPSRSKGRSGYRLLTNDVSHKERTYPETNDKGDLLYVDYDGEWRTEEELMAKYKRSPLAKLPVVSARMSA